MCVLLWGMAAAKRINLIIPDEHGNTPMHYAALAESTEVIVSISIYVLSLMIGAGIGVS